MPKDRPHQTLPVRRWTTLIPLILLTFGCGQGSDSGSATTPLSLTQFSIVSGSPTVSESSLSGSGALVYNDPTTRTAENYRLKFTLADGGSLTWVSFGSASLANGVETRFSRSGTTLTTTLLFNNGSSSGSDTFTGIDASGTIELYLDVHNSETPAHVLLFQSGTTTFSEVNATLNSEGGQFSGWASNGTGGNFFGVRLNNAILTEVIASSAKFAD